MEYPKDKNERSKEIICNNLENGRIKSLVCNVSEKVFFRSYALQVIETKTIDGIVCFDGQLTCCQRGCCRKSFIELSPGDLIKIERLVSIQLPNDWGIGQAFIVSINDQRILLNEWMLMVSIRYHRFSIKKD